MNKSFFAILSDGTLPEDGECFGAACARNISLHVIEPLQGRPVSGAPKHRGHQAVTLS
ncbi:hypothetical protein [Novosphingobium sp. PhB165]|uniref:hypothetical protein n=1 Tax=Novosphingobium sp. PhB165 TaxID=2485105 RepID=UPI0014053488|nr:hypothetical protein [Novosphingobium sp. PhB165]